MSIMTQPRPVVQMGDYYGPEPRKLVADEGDDAALAASVAAAVVG
jgi:hypothetical protein